MVELGFDNYFQGRFLAQSACMRHVCLHAPCVAWPLLLQSFSLSFFLSLSSVFCFLPTQGNHPIFWHNQKIYAKKKYFFGVNFIFLRKKGDVWTFFLLFTASVRSRPPGPPAVPGVFSKVFIAEQKLNYVQLVAPEHQNDFKIVNK